MHLLRMSVLGLRLSLFLFVSIGSPEVAFSSIVVNKSVFPITQHGLSTLGNTVFSEPKHLHQLSARQPLSTNPISAPGQCLRLRCSRLLSCRCTNPLLGRQCALELMRSMPI